MAKTTVKFDMKDENVRFFWTFNEGKKNRILCLSFEKGIVTVLSSLSCKLDEAAEIVAGCFDEDSNFEFELVNAFNSDTKLKAINLEYNGITITVTSQNANASEICKAWNKELYRRIYNQYRDNSKYREVIRIDETTEMEFKNEEAAKNWQEFENANSVTVVGYTRRWAKYMQYLMHEHNKDISEICEIASDSSEIEGITGYIKWFAFNVLIQTWKYGDELRKTAKK